MTEPEVIVSALRRGPFLRSFGRLTPVQEGAIPAILAGRSAVLCSPTATGKTEAALAPLVYRHLPAGTEVLRILYVAPTRALVNDLVRRIEAPLHALRLTLFARTGDTGRLPKSPRFAVLVTTPESLDSLLCRAPGLFSNLVAVVLDELHLIDGSYRGDQLRVLLNRLPAGLQRVALSATVHDPAALAARYVGEDAVIVDAGERRQLDLRLVDDPAEAIRLCKAARRHKILWFANRRADVESLAVGLAAFWPRNRLVAHHGSLSRRERLEVEKAMQEWAYGLCVATMTLEIGVDIGDVDAVVLYGPPPTPSAFQQRIGRACRREARIFAVGLCLGPGDADSFRELERLAGEGIVEAAATAPDTSVAVQQVLSLLFGSPAGLQRDRIEAVVAPIAGATTIAAILQHLASEGWLELMRGGLVRATTRLMDAGETGRIHGNIPDGRELRFKDARTGRALGTALADVQVGDVVVLAGSTRRVVSRAGGEVQLDYADGAAASPRFRARPAGGAWRWLLPEPLR